MIRLRPQMGIILGFIFLSGCASQIMQYDGDQNMNVVEEYEKMVKVETIPEEKKVPEGKDGELAPPSGGPSPKTVQVKKVKKPTIFKKISSRLKREKLVQEKLERLPKIEPSEGFLGRRPMNDPYIVNEKVVLDINYFKVSAGTLTLETKPYVEVNKKKAYHFMIGLKTSKMFSMFYSVNDWAETFLDYDEMKPHSFQLHVKESKQLKEVRTFFDWSSLKGHYWEKRVTKEDGEEKRKKVWDIPAYAQNSLSALFYIRSFPLAPGKTVRFNIANDGENLLFTARVLRKEKIETVVGKLDTVVVKPEFKVGGVFKPVGDIFFWFTDDDRRLLVQLESEIKIGKIVGKLKSLRR